MNYYELAKAAIEKVFSDTTKTPERTLEDLQSLKEEIDMLMDAIETDLED